MRITNLLLLLAVFALVACKGKEPIPALPQGPAGSITHYIDGKIWQNTNTAAGAPDITARKTKGGLELTARNITGIDTTIAYFFLKDFNGSGRRFLINPLDSTAFPDTISSSFGYFGLQSILKRRQPAITLFGTSGIITIDPVKADNLLYGSYSMEVTINNKETIITDGSFNGVRLQ